MMNKFASFSVAVLCAVGIFSSCNLSKDDQSDIDLSKLDFVLADIRSSSIGYDRLICKDESHIILTSFYNNGRVKEHLLISDKDTITIRFSEDGFPKMLFDGSSYLIFGGFAGNSIHVGTLDKQGTTEITEIETDIDWKEYAKKMTGSPATRSGTQMDYQIANVQDQTLITLLTSVFENSALFTVASPSWLSRGSWYTFLITGLAYAISDNATWLEYVSAASEGMNVVIHVAAGATAGTYAVLVYYNIKTWADVATIAWEGYKNGSFGPWWEQDFDLFVKELDSRVWLSPSSGYFSWERCSGVVCLRIGIEDFDPTDITWEYCNNTDWIHLEKHIEGERFWLSYTIDENDKQGPREYGVKMDVTGRDFISDDLSFMIHQSSRLQVSSNRVIFSSMDPQVVTVTSEDSWEVSDYPKEWLSYEIQGIATQRVRELKLIPLSIDGEHDDNVVLTARTLTGSTYDVIIRVTNKNENSICPDENHPHLIDMGLPLKWSCCNVGATAPEEKGGFYAWGETSEKDDYTHSNYKYSDGTDDYNNEDSYTKYNTVELCRLDPSDDVATVLWGDGWQMPTINHYDELIGNTTYEYTTYNGQYGYMFTSTITGSRLFFPFAGMKSYGVYWDSDLCGFYWTSEKPYFYYVRHLMLSRWELFFEWGGGHDYPYHGYSVRPISSH